MVAAVPQRVGILGGAFDPPHTAHVALAQAAISQLALDALIVVPTGHAWHKPRHLSAAEHRLAMTALAFAALPQVRIDACETQRSGPSYTVDTLLALRRAAPLAQWFLIIGADQAVALTSWKRWPEIVQSAIICVADRPHATGVQVPFAAELAQPQRFLHLQLPARDVDATSIRRAVAAGHDVTPLVGASVARYIADHHLYLND